MFEKHAAKLDGQGSAGNLKQALQSTLPKGALSVPESATTAGKEENTGFFQRGQKTSGQGHRLARLSARSEEENKRRTSKGQEEDERTRGDNIEGQDEGKRRTKGSQRTRAGQEEEGRRTGAASRSKDRRRRSWADLIKTKYRDFNLVGTWKDRTRAMTGTLWAGFRRTSRLLSSGVECDIDSENNVSDDETAILVAPAATLPRSDLDLSSTSGLSSHYIDPGLELSHVANA